MPDRETEDRLPDVLVAPSESAGDGEKQTREAAARLFRNARREALLVVLVWALALTWVVGYCYLRGYRHDPESWVVQAGLAAENRPEQTPIILGLPEWVLVGILVPWILCTAFTVVFCVFIMKDDELGAEAEEGGAHGH